MMDIDPEARPSVVETFNVVKAVCKGRACPAIPLSEEALRRRAEREERERKREMKAHAKKASREPIVPPRKVPAAVDPNSVAARRLAAKKGVATVGVQSQGPAEVLATSNAQITSSNSNLGEVDLFNIDGASGTDAAGAAPSTAASFFTDFDFGQVLLYIKKMLCRFFSSVLWYSMLIVQTIFIVCDIPYIVFSFPQAPQVIAMNLQDSGSSLIDTDFGSNTSTSGGFTSSFSSFPTAQPLDAQFPTSFANFDDTDSLLTGNTSNAPR